MGKARGLTVKGRIYGGFSAVLVLLLLVSGVSIYGFGSISTDMLSYSKLSTNTSLVQQVERDVVGLRRNAYIYSQEGTPQSLDRVRELQTSLRKNLNAAIAASTSPERKANLEQMLRLFEQYSANFEKVVELKTRTDSQFNTVLAPTGAEISKNLTDLIDATLAGKDWETASYAGRAADSVAHMRMTVLRFVADPDTRHLDAFKQQAMGANKALKFLSDTEKDADHRRTIEAAYALLPTYDRTFQDIAGATLEIDRLVNKENAALATQFGNLSASTRQSALGSLDAIRDATGKSIDVQQTAAGVVSALAIAIGLAAAALIARSILGPINRMTHAMGELAGGKLDVTVPALERRDEIGEMAQAVQVFKQNAVDKQRMEQEAEAARVA
ncbi:MAG TPA: HAMP domain-containing protein, partial [Magnetospirillum sp.]|nr:HAMP domain-containing protein [Magnetospirillum sp.]